MTAAITVRNLTKSYGDVHAVRGVDLDVAEGEIVAFLGHNGAGKTTTVEILEGFRSRTDGHVEVLGVDPARAGRHWRERLGIVLQESEPTPELTAQETLALHAGYYESSRSVDDVLALVGLDTSRDQRAGKLSGGQKRRLDLGLALIGDPELIFLDEPTTGFDPSARRDAWDMIANLRALGRTVLLTTHYMDEAEFLADRIVVIADGVIVANGTAEQLRIQVGAKPTISWTGPEDAPVPQGLEAAVVDGRVSVETEDVLPALHSITGWAIDNNMTLDNLQVRQPSLEDVYLQLTGMPVDPISSDGGPR